MYELMRNIAHMANKYHRIDGQGVMAIIIVITIIVSFATGIVTFIGIITGATWATGGKFLCCWGIFVVSIIAMHFIDI